MDDLVLYIVARRDLDMPAGKLAAQAGHAVQGIMKWGFGLLQEDFWPLTDQNQTWFRDYIESESMTKVVLQVNSLNELLALENKLKADYVKFVEVIDEGRTCLEPNTLTCIGIQPLPKGHNSDLAKLKVYR